VGLRSFRTAGLLMVGLLLYDVFWVFGSPQVVGDNVMLTVATSDMIVGEWSQQQRWHGWQAAWQSSGAAAPHSRGSTASGMLLQCGMRVEQRAHTVACAVPGGVRASSVAS
jgi:hypothetical protein